MADALVTASDVETRLPGVTRHTVYKWARRGLIKLVDKNGRSPLYRWSEIVDADRRTRANRQSARNIDRQRERLAA